MVYSETMTVSIDARNTLIRNRDNIKARLGVEMYFPRSGVRGGYQDMVLKGTTGTVPRAIREVNMILAAWKQEYDAFKQRKRERRLASRQQDAEAVVWPSLASDKPKTKVVSNNMFDLLTVDEPRTKQEAKKVLVPKPVKVKAAKLTGWAAMAAKPAEAAKPAMAAKSAIASKPAEAAEIKAVKAPMETGCDAWPSLTDDEYGETDNNSVVYSSWKSMEGVSWGDEEAWGEEDELVDSVVNDPWTCRDY